jgi:hypothetical protein
MHESHRPARLIGALTLAMALAFTTRAKGQSALESFRQDSIKIATALKQMSRTASTTGGEPWSGPLRLSADPSCSRAAAPRFRSK